MANTSQRRCLIYDTRLRPYFESPISIPKKPTSKAISISKKKDKTCDYAQIVEPPRGLSIEVGNKFSTPSGISEPK